MLLKRVCVTCALSVIAFSQQPQPPTIRTKVPLVLVPAVVTDKRGNFIEGLSVDDFVVNDDGVQQKIRMDTSDMVLAPVSIVVAIQSSGISYPALQKINKVGGMIQPLVIGQRGQCAVIAYDLEVRVFQDFTSDSTKIHAAFEAIEARTIKQAKMIDAVMEGVKMLDTRGENYRRVLLVVGESRDRGSKTKRAAAIEALQRAGVEVYFLTYSVQGETWTAKPENAPPMPGGADGVGAIIELGRMGTSNDASALAKATGGRHMSFLKQSALETAIARAGEEIHSQYLLSFVPQESKNEKLHQIEVKVPRFPEAVVRARPGYWPEK